MSISVQSLSFAYGQHRVLEDISFAAQEGSLVAVLGPNGVGKSTLFQCMLGLRRGYTGQIDIGGQSIRVLTPSRLARLVAYIPQSHQPAFHYAVLDMVLMGAAARLPVFAQPGRAERAAALEALDAMGLADYADRDYMKLSGGEQQLVLIARALAQKSRVLVMDEPTANLDYGNQLRVLARIRALAGEGYTILFSTHNPDHALWYAHRVLALHEGRMIAQGTPEETVTPALLKALYGIDVACYGTDKDGMRVCVPQHIPNHPHEGGTK